MRSMGVSYFFFSSRRRHTRYWRDWSSDVCSSDLSSIAICSPSVAEVQRLNAPFLAELEVALQLGEDVVLVDQVVIVVYVLHRPLEDEERDHIPGVFIHDERVDVARRLVDERARTRHPVSFEVAPGALDAIAEDLAAGMAVAVDLAAALDLEDVDPAPAGEVKPQGFEPDPLSLRHPGQLVAVDGHVGQAHLRDDLLRPLFRQDPLLS